MEQNKVGHTTYKRGKLYFDDAGWTIVKAVAKRKKKTPTQVVVGALKRYARENEKAKKS